MIQQFLATALAAISRWLGDRCQGRIHQGTQVVVEVGGSVERVLRRVESRATIS